MKNDFRYRMNEQDVRYTMNETSDQTIIDSYLNITFQEKNTVTTYILDMPRVQQLSLIDECLLN